jgi:hypothetical protein
VGIFTHSLVMMEDTTGISLKEKNILGPNCLCILNLVDIYIFDDFAKRISTIASLRPSLQYKTLLGSTFACVRGDNTKTVRVFGSKKLFLKRFTVRSTTRTLIIDKNDHSAFTPI